MICCCSVTKSCPTLCDPMDCSTSGFLVLYYLLEFSQTHIHWVGDGIQSSHPLSPPLLLLSSIFPSIRVFLMSCLFTSGGQSIGISASASVLSVNIQGWFPWGLTGLIYFQSKRLSRVFSSTTIWKHQFSGAQRSLGPTLIPIHEYWKVIENSIELIFISHTVLHECK